MKICTCGNELSFNALYHQPSCAYRQDMFERWWKSPDHGVVCYRTDPPQVLAQKQQQAREIMKKLLQVAVLVLVWLSVATPSYAQQPPPPVLPFDFHPYDVPSGGGSGSFAFVEKFGSVEFLTALVNWGLTIFKMVTNNELILIATTVIGFMIFIRFVYNFVIAKDDGIEFNVRDGLKAMEDVANTQGYNIQNNPTFRTARSTFKGRSGVYAGGRRIF